MNAVTILLKVLKDPKMLLGVGFLLLIGAFWFMAPMLGIRGMTRLITVGSLLVVWLILQIILFVLAGRKQKKQADDLEASLIIEADESVEQASAAQKKAKEEARKELISAIELLKKSELGGKGGKKALYALPWYLVLGAAESGKSSMIRNSGLQKPDQGPGDLKGIGTSVNCEWWFTNQAVVLEADRRFFGISSNDGDRAAESGWAVFLQQLGKQRSRTPVNGAVVTLSALDLLEKSAGELESQARLIRRRLDAMRTHLKQVFPVYVVITKLDRVHGFEEYFHTLDDPASAQILGATIRGKHMKHPEPEKVVDAEFQVLYQTLARRRDMVMVRENDLNVRAGSYLFPLEFHRLRAGLKSFVRTMGEANAYGASPLMRGIYFTGAGGTGEVSNAVLTEVSQVIGLPGAGSAAVTAPPPPTGPTRPYFLFDLFRRVIVPDHTIARPTRGAAQQAHVMKRTFQYAAIAAMIAFGALMTISFGRNLALVNETKVLAEQALNVSGGVTTLPEIGQALTALDGLRLQLERLDELDKKRGPTLGLGFYRGSEVNGQARHIYLERLREVLVLPSRDVLELKLELPLPRQGDIEGNERFYNRYRVYRMLFAPVHGDADLMSGELQQLWTDQTRDGEVRDRDLTLIDEHVRYAQRHADVFDRYCGTKTPDPRLREKGNDYVRANWRPQTFYDHLIVETNRRVASFQLDPVRHGGLTALEVVDGVESGVDVPGAFTQKGWQEEVRGRILNSDEELREDWLLKEVFDGRSAGILSELISFYEEDYQQAWNHFLSHVDFSTQTSLNQATSLITDLKNGDAPFYALIEEASTQLRFDEDEGEVGREVRRAMRNIEDSYRALHLFVDNREAQPDAGKPRDAYLGLLEEIRTMLVGLRTEDALLASTDYTRAVFTEPTKENQIRKLRVFAATHCLNAEGGSARANEALTMLLRRPAAAAWRACLVATQENLDKNWREQVQSRFQSDLGTKYPFKRTQQSVALADFTDFFGPGGTVDAFLTEQMSAYLEKDRTAKQVYGDGLHLGEGMIAAMRRADDYRLTLFDGSGALGVHCDLTATQIEILGGTPPGFIGSQLMLGKQRLIYDNGPPKRGRFHWPDEDGTVPARVFVLCVDGNCEKPTENRVAPDNWSFFRLLDQAAMPDDASRKSEFELKFEQDGGGRYRIGVPYRLKADSRRHPFWPGFFRFQCPTELAG